MTFKEHKLVTLCIHLALPVLCPIFVPDAPQGEIPLPIQHMKWRSSPLWTRVGVRIPTPTAWGMLPVS